MAFSAPIQDILFVLDELADLPGVLALPGFEDCSRDLVQAVLEENGKFVEQALAPLNRVGDRVSAQWADGTVTMPAGFAKAFHEFAAAGWQGLQHDTKWGGQGLPKLVGAPASENLNAANLSFSLCPLLTDGVIEALTRVGSPEQQSAFMPPLLQGRWTGTMNLTEPQAGSDLARVAAKAVRQDDGTYRISGQKIFITYGEHDLAENIVHLVLARTPDAPAGVKGISLFIVPKFLTAQDGSLGARNDVWCASIEHKLGIHASPTAVLLYGAGKGEVGEGGAVGYLVGEETHGLEYMFIMMNAARFAVGLQGIAVSERALQQAQAYAAERVQGQALDNPGRSVTIDQHPDVQRMLASMRALTESARALAYCAAGARDKSLRHPDERERAWNQALFDYLVPIVKGFSTENAVEVASLGVQVHGGMGFIEETGAAQHYRDARILPIYEGTTAIQANDLVGRKTLRDGGKVAAELARRMRATLAELQAQADSGGRSGPGTGASAAGATGAVSGSGELALIARRFEAAIQAYEQAVAYVLDTASKEPRAVYLGSVPYLMLSGFVLAGWQMARAALACCRIMPSGAGDAFHARKLASCVFYAAYILPRTQALATAILEGDGAANAALVICKK
ncbi:acyl-CoA dehydrogenase [Eoetvoesiella caeni]|uniref:3-methylmercaptopropionyl-CoA dehydrogenase n=1 Tax=Eoetvoesiella caeni TaxID=645616 RepID=A0A366HL05_9BURK|nr:acyl-CoA dehydrogenase [Eoetvoesiella caeni]MCI2807349.1 acyl-CoA dehydrogenase [Eoetvoesiella caeni]NYT53256.1 acyl-CoA dehydrogenase [Eoetvoesiella caeni]RBP43237.1 alkylation response protein AidB-like acyl-CoA dehydrogenase [Eoetvoesiella caeni]